MESGHKAERLLLASFPQRIVNSARATMQLASFIQA
jgi:hypothetical protein